RRNDAPEEFVSQAAEDAHEDTPETLDRDMANIQERLKVFLENNPEAATRAANVPGLDRLLGN
ncbi:MAG: hypothetical protein JWO80_911, partial [Bryobacterales bacterium]|nr:hypothetical protein [Bryobacterales bacterium]